MISAIIFALHGAALVYAFLKYKKESLSDGFLSCALICIVFAVGWTIATMLTNLLFMPDFFIRWYYQPLESRFWILVRKELNRDTISLLMLTAGEVVFYYFYFTIGKKKDPSSDGSPQ